MNLLAVVSHAYVLAMAGINNAVGFSGHIQHIILFCYLQFHRFLLLFNITVRCFGAYSSAYENNPIYNTTLPPSLN